MKKLIVIALAGVTALAVQAISLTEARAQISKCVADPATMTSVMKSIDSADGQIQFLKAVNEAIQGMPGAAEKKAAAYLNSNKAALLGADRKNLAKMLAEIYATVPVEVLPTLSERLAEDLFNRSADPSKTYTDEQFTQIANVIMKAVSARAAGSDDGAVRVSFAISMLNDASGGTPEDLAAMLAASVPAGMREEVAKDLPDAISHNYDALLEKADAEEQPIVHVVMRLAGPQLLQSLLGQVVEDTPVVEAQIMDVIYGNPTSSDMEAIVTPPSEPIGYQGQY